jgi:hypothetical protein
MGKITNEARKRYFDKQTEYKQAIDQGLAREKIILDLLSKDESGAGYKRLTLAEDALSVFSYYILMNTLSLSLLGVKNEDMLTEGRKTLYRAMKYVEDVVTPYVDVPFSEYEKKLEEIENFEPEKRYSLLRKFGFAIKQLEDGFGDNSKWKWSFVEIWAKYATIAKNLLNLKTTIANLDFSSPYREVTTYHLQLVKKLFQQTADRYREKYELVTTKIEDFRFAITYLSALRRIHILLGEKDESETLKKKIDIWSTKMEADIKKQDDGKKLQKREPPQAP